MISVYISGKSLFLQKYIKNVRTQNKCRILLLTGSELSTNEGVFCDKVVPYNTDAICWCGHTTYCER